MKSIKNPAHQISKKFYKNKTGSIFAFTLAEILITITIIGVVSALTLPVLNNKIQYEISKSQAKKIYATMLNAMRMIEADGNEHLLAGCQNGRGKETCADFWHELGNKMKLSKICNSKALQNGCIPDYNFQHYRPGDCPGYNLSMIKNNSTVFVLSNGAIIIPYYDTWYSVNSRFHPYFIVDINGHKGPNKVGTDIFDVILNKSGNSNIPKIATQNCLLYPPNSNRFNNLLK